MALATYADLLAVPNTWMHRTDMAAVAPDFVTLTEAELNRQLSTSLQLVKASITINAEFVAKPSGFRQVRSLRLTTGTGRLLREMTPEQMTTEKAIPSPLVAEPRAYAAIGSQFEFWPIPDASYTAALEYQGGFAPLSGSNTTNWILSDHPDAYLFGVLAAACAFLKQDQRAVGFKAQFNAAVADVQRALRTTYDRTLRADPGLLQRPRDRVFNILTGD